jgi:aryl-alcohol dehydrogenase-like predicted oxidoreductase
MEYRRLGRTGLDVSLMSQGTGGPSLFGQRRGTTLDEARTLIHRALDHGINFFDTAQLYSDSEVLLGNALEGVSRASYLLATKYQYEDEEGSIISPVAVTAAIDRALCRLRVDTIDVMQVHGLLPECYDKVIEQQLPALYEAQAAGKIRFIGVSERYFDDPRHATIQRVLADNHFDTVMVGYNLLHQTAERDVFPDARAADVGVIIMIAVRRVLSDPKRLREVVADLVSRGLLPADILPPDDPLGWLVHDEIKSVTGAAYRFARHSDSVSTVLTGTSRTSHLDANVAAIAQGPLAKADHRRLQEMFGDIEEAIGN